MTEKAPCAKCSECPLVDAAHCPSEAPSGPCKLLILADQPGLTEVSLNRPLSGHYGWYLNRALEVFPEFKREPNSGAISKHAWVTNVLLCEGANNLEKEQLAQAVRCCAPRLMNEFAIHRPMFAFAVGKKAFAALTGLNAEGACSEWQGGLVPSLPKFEGLQLVTSPWPAQPYQIPVFKQFARRAAAYALGKLQPWVWDNLVVDDFEDRLPLLDALERLAKSKEPLAVDVENTGDPMDGKLLCVGVSDTKLSVSVWWPCWDPEVESLLCHLLVNHKRGYIGHNATHDRIVLEQAGIKPPTHWHDTLSQHFLCSPRLSHALGFVASNLLPIDKWKSEYNLKRHIAEFEAGASRPTCRDLMLYNAKDARATALCHRELQKHLKKVNNGSKLYQNIVNLTEIAYKMKKYGVGVDEEARQAHRQHLLAVMDREAAKFAHVAFDGFRLGKNGQHPDTKRLFLEHFGLEARAYSKKTGKPSLGLSCLAAHKRNPDPEISQLAEIVYTYRKAAQILTHTVEKATPRKGKLHPDWRACGAVSQRWRCARPNLMNWTGSLRNIIVPPVPGWEIVGFDVSQFELRIAALLSGAELLLEWYDKGVDVHVKHAQVVWPGKAPSKEKAKERRDLAKPVAYGILYNNSDDVSAILDKLQQSHPTMTEHVLKKVRKKIFETHPQLPRWQRRTIREAQERGYTEELLSGWRIHFNDGMADPNFSLNLPIQGLAAKIMNDITLEIDAELDWGRGERILAQIHDALYMTGPDPDRLEGLIDRYATKTIELNGHKMTFPVDKFRGPNMRDLEK